LRDLALALNTVTSAIANVLLVSHDMQLTPSTLMSRFGAHQADRCLQFCIGMP
jgi:hypothetical protein